MTSRLASLVRDHLLQDDVESAGHAFLQLPDVETNHRDLLKDVLHDNYIAGMYATPTLLRFFKQLPSWAWTLDGVDILLTATKELGVVANDALRKVNLQRQCPVFPIAVYLHRLIKDKLQGEDRLRAKEFWHSRVSSTLRAIVKGRAFEIASRHEAMYAPADSLSFDNERRLVFTWVPEWSPDHDKEKWHITPVDPKNISSDWFLIRNLHTQEYLYATNCFNSTKDSTGRSRSWAFLWRPKNEIDKKNYWRLVPVDPAEENEFALYNRYTEEFLISNDLHDKERRIVATSPQLKNTSSWRADIRWKLSPAALWG
ncbi:hypothetical protein KRP22_001747 [Phytophthora ramorum]|nr:hypothetical protein KRP22_1029 [Phytophthora ramorum]